MATSDYTELLTKLSEAGIDTAKQVVEINIQTGDKLLEQQVELTGSFLTAATRNVELITKAKGYPEVLGAQAQIAQQWAQQLLAGYRHTTAILTEASKSLAAVVDQAASKARENVAKAA